MKGLFVWVGFLFMVVFYEWLLCKVGIGKFNYWKFWNFVLDGIIGFIIMLLCIWFYGGVLVLMFVFGYVFYFMLCVVFFGSDVFGYVFLMVVLLFFFGV